MKNLEVLHKCKLKLEATILGHCVDADNKRYIVITDDLSVLEIGDFERPKPIKHDLGKTFDKICPDNIILIEYIVESGSICVVLKDGRVISIGISSFSPPSGCIYTHSDPISSCKFTPDQDLVALADVKNDIFVLSSDFVIAHSSNALINNESAHKPVGVGWGSKETQFFGLDGRPAKEKQSKEKIILNTDELNMVDEIESSITYKQSRSKHERSTVVDWRGDGQLLATFTYICEVDKHYLKIWNRNLELQYVSEQLITMERGLLTWVPNGQYVCTTQRRENLINEVAMFEKNGMVHQRITLPTSIPHLYIDDLLWSPDSKILSIIAVEYIKLDSMIHEKRIIFFYTMQNFHFYLKYSGRIDFGESSYSMRWDPIYNNILYISSRNGYCVEYTCKFTVDHCRQDNIVAVVDANRLHLTPFSICNVPPPMSALTIELDTLINRLIIHPEEINKSFIIDINDKIISFSPHQIQTLGHVQVNIDTDTMRELATKLAQLFVGCLCSSSRLQSFVFIDDKSVLVIEDNEHRNQINQVAKIDLVPDESSLRICYSSIDTNKNFLIIYIVKNSYNKLQDTILVILDDFSYCSLNLSTGEYSTKFTLSNTSDRQFISEAQYIMDIDLVMTLTMNMTLLANDKIVVSNCCTSFKTTENFLIYTTTDNMIHLVCWNKLFLDIDRKDIGSWSQPIENGGTLILVSESESKVILQMPRGNLEILHPRIMILLRITRLLDQDSYLSAMKLARRFRVDLNFLADYMIGCSKEIFFSIRLAKLASQFLQSDISLLNLFITELDDGDTTKGRYSNAMSFLPIPTPTELSEHRASKLNKVNEICLALMSILSPCHLQPTILCLLKQKPAKTGQALGLIHQLDKKDQKEEALKFMLYFVQIDQLFNDAISTYSVDIAVMVASVSSKDPKEYLALLDHFRKIDHNHLRRYHMDKHTKNYDKAFSNLLLYYNDQNHGDKSTKVDLIDLVVSKRIYKHAVRELSSLIKTKMASAEQGNHIEERLRELLRDIWIKYGEYLLEKKYHMEAGIAFLNSLELHSGTSDNDDDRVFDQVIKCFLIANEYERCVAVLQTHKSKVSISKRQKIIQSISDNLLEQREFARAILVQQTTKIDEMALQLCDKGSWALAEMLVTDETRQELLKRILKAVHEAADSFSASLESNLTTALSHFERLKALFLLPPKQDYFGVENCYNADTLSTIDGSETNSSILESKPTGTKVTRSGAPSVKTRTSSRSNKSQTAKKKKVNLKVGSRHEDIALVIELKKFIINQKSDQEDARNLLASYRRYCGLETDEPNIARIFKLMKESFELARNIRSSLWPKSDQEENANSIYKRFAKSVMSGEYVDNLDLEILIRPELLESIVYIDF